MAVIKTQGIPSDVVDFIGGPLDKGCIVTFNGAKIYAAGGGEYRMVDGSMVWQKPPESPETRTITTPQGEGESNR